MARMQVGGAVVEKGDAAGGVGDGAEPDQVHALHPAALEHLPSF